MKLEDAIIIATRVHRGQRDKGGHPYIEHPLRVMLAVQSEREKIAAVLHDVIEDAGRDRVKKEFEDLDLWPPSWLRTALDALTKKPGEEYFVYVARAAANPIARAVKEADLRDNMRLERIPNPSAADRERVEKYRRALDMLLSGTR